MENTVFPFVAVIGQDAVKKALIWNIVNPRIGGVLISGGKGTAKSTLVRGTGRITSGMNIIELPLNATEDRLCGSIDFEHALKHGEKRPEEGILRKAHGNLLYVDEVNLLSDHITKILCEPASSGMYRVEREGISCLHAAQFILAGSMNPEEGGLRPQLLDRFGLYVEVKGENDARKRAEIIRRRLAYEKNPFLFISRWNSENEKLRLNIKRAKEIVKKIAVSPHALRLAASMAEEGHCEGHRGELVIIETAKAIAALDSRIALNIYDIKEAAQYALPHRVREKSKNPEQNQSKPEADSQKALQTAQDRADNAPQDDFTGSSRENEPAATADGDPASGADMDCSRDSAEEQTEADDSMLDSTIDAPDQSFTISGWLAEKSKNIIRKESRKGSGRRSLVKTRSKEGRYVRYRYPVKGEINDIAIAATLRIAALYQQSREKKGKALVIERSDIRIKVREKRIGNTIIFVVDTSGSMGAHKRMKAVKGAVISLLKDAYQKRDKVGMITFKNYKAELILGITRSVEFAEKKLTDLPTGGKTPLAAGLDMAYDVIKAAKKKDKDILPVIVLVSDGKATYASNSADAFEAALNSSEKIANENIKSIVIDADQNYIKLHLAEKIAKVMHADYFQVDELRTQSIVAAVSLSTE